MTIGKLTLGSQSTAVTGECPGAVRTVTELAEGLVATVLGSIGQIKTPLRQPTAKSLALKGFQAMHDTHF